MGKILNYNDEELVVTRDQAAEGGRTLRGEAAEKLHELLTRPAQEPTPRMKEAIENYKRLMSMKRSPKNESKS